MVNSYEDVVKIKYNSSAYEGEGYLFINYTIDSKDVAPTVITILQ